MQLQVHGTEVRILKVSGSWAKVEIYGDDNKPIVGWAASRYIKE